MDPRLLRYYNQELGHLREMGAEFALQFPKIAARLGMDGMEVSDPYVERLLEGFAFLAARVQLKIDSEFPRFTQRMLEILYPQFLAPTPSMVVAQFKPDISDANLARGFPIPRGSTMQSQIGPNEATACEFRTAHAINLLPIEIQSASYFSFAPDLPLTQLPVGGRIKGGLRVRLKAGGDLGFDKINLSRLPIHFSGGDDIAFKLHELMLGACAGVLVLPPARPAPWFQFLPASTVKPLGFEDDQALLPVTLRGFQGYRLLHEYFSFPHRFLFAELDGLDAAMSRATGDEIELVFLFSRGDPALESVVDAGNLSLFCTPAVNLLAKRADRIHLNDGTYDYHVIPDRTRPMDFEVYDIESVTGYGVGNDAQRTFMPLYAAFHSEQPEHEAYYTVQREPRLMSVAQKRHGARTSYIGSEVFISLVDPKEAPFSNDLKQLAITTLCTNRDLPMMMPIGLGKTDFTLDSSAPVLSVRALKGPSKPYSSLREGNVAWRFINHLSLNHLSLLNNSEQEGAAALREMLGLYMVAGDSAQVRQIEGLRTVRVKPLVRRFPLPGPVTFGRGLEITLEVDDLAFQGASVFLFGAVMERFMSRYVSINSFVETALRSSGRGEVMRWVPRCGERAII